MEWRCWGEGRWDRGVIVTEGGRLRIQFAAEVAASWGMPLATVARGVDVEKEMVKKEDVESVLSASE